MLIQLKKHLIVFNILFCDHNALDLLQNTKLNERPEMACPLGLLDLDTDLIKCTSQVFHHYNYISSS